MAMKTIRAENLAQAYSSGNWEYTTWDGAYAGFNGGSLHCAYILRFDVPEFSGISEELKLELAARSGIGTDVTLRWAICTSDVNRESYHSTTEAVIDKNQLDSGIVTFSNLRSTAEKKTVQLKTSKLRAGGTYYLILWAAEATGMAVVAVSTGHSIAIGYNLGVIRVKSGGAVKAHTAFVKIGGKIRQVIPYVKTAGGVKPGG
jgi:hypothetical protein